MRSNTITFSATGRGPGMVIKKDQTLLYKVDLASFVGTLILRRTQNGGALWETAATITADSNGTAITLTAQWTYEFFCSAFTSGTAACTLFNMDEEIVGVLDPGVPNGSTVTANERGGVVHQTILTLASTPLSIVSVTTGAGVGGIKVYDFPQGRILLLGCMADLALGIETEADFTDATPEGDIAVGSVAPADADGLGTDPTDDDMSTATAFTMAAYDALVSIPSEASLQFDGVTTAIDMLVNALVDAADIDDDTTTNLLVSGSIIFHWINLGDF